MKQARNFVQQGKSWVVDIDIKAFFDEVNHDIFTASNQPENIRPPSVRPDKSVSESGCSERRKSRTTV
ncbi:RNA-dependent RNA polymerase family protein [Methylobacter marinus]|uniref:hypothetical protein n=1 Tax=Methylobacter marinus TaxID=34058 RepID=UPI0003A5FA45